MAEALVVCSNKSSATGITIMEMKTGEQILHIPTCASPPHGLCCLRNHFLFASQIHRHGSVGGGAIFMWHLNKPQPPLRSYPLEAIGPLSCTKDGVYLSGGALSGNAYIWEVSSGKLLKIWRAHHRSLTCMLFSDDGSLFISGSEDGMICVWSMISLLDVEVSDSSSASVLHFSLEHNTPITSLSTTSSVSSSSILVSSSNDGTCKVSDLVLGRIIRTVVYPQAITEVLLHPAGQILVCGSLDGRIFINKLDFEDQPVELQGHNGAVTALTFSQSGLVSASEDCTICIWDVTTWTITQKFNHQKGAVTNLAVILRSSLLPVANNNRKVSNPFRVSSSLDKYPQHDKFSKETITLIPSSSYCSLIESFQSTDSCQQILNLQSQKEWTPAAMQMKVETCIKSRIWALKMTKHVMEMNRHLQTRLLDLMQSRFLRCTETDESHTTKRRKKFFLKSSCKDSGSPLQDEHQ
ncbi:protein ROOT INITIATION DEFECTIVE 3-like isoform X2 [Humulus lupulus]|uniref:protein ROOT INITIATION DEFECTIVE 3-like isoform X2 n=1 Tax=Humulus lupulus TaxID=3486 RepID=UPI002B405A7B|nr:protein ROOT INITIATION DEFECTIVE 3-like isoform X2 [Humulus lupulus]